ncbi:MAG: hypothetical protein SPL43_05910 [Prevotella sp.]|nr:hypothetical protein [Prevotella sp.]
MDHNLLHLSARIRAFCVVLALFLLPGAVHADDVYLLTSQKINGTDGNYNVPSNHKFTNSSGTVYTYTITSMPTDGFYFRIGVSGLGYNIQPYKNDDALNINGDSYTITSDCHGNTNAWKVSYKDGDYSSLTITVDLSTTKSYVKITGVKKGSTGGGTSTSANQEGLYLFGSSFGATKSTDRLTYKFVRKNDSEYHFALYASSKQFSVPEYSGDGNKDITPSWDGYQFTIAYIDADGNFSTFCPTDKYNLTGTDPNASKGKSFGNNTQWTIQNNGGMYDFVVKVDDNGKPTKWYYESDANRIVAYKASSTSNWTTEGFLYCVKDANNDVTSYCKNFFGTIPMVKDEEFKFIVGDYWFGKRDDNETYDQNPAINGSKAAPNFKNPYDGIYPVEFNPDRDYQLGGKDETPLRIFMIGSALNSNLSDTYADWDPTQAVELVYDKDEQCYKGTVSLAKGKQFRFLRDKNASGSATSLDLNFGEDDNTPGKGGDTDYNNYVAYQEASTSGTNITFNPETNTYNVRFYIEAGTNMANFSWSSAKFRYTIELPARLNVSLTPTAATVPFGTSLTPRVNVVGTNSKTRTYAYTLDGTDPTIDTATGEGTGTTKVVTYTYDEVIPANDLTTFYMSTDGKLCYIDAEGTEQTLTGNTVTVKVQAVQTITSGSKYRLEGDIATGNYIFNKSGHQATATYTLSVTNDNTGTTPSINKATAKVVVTNTDTKTDDGVDVFYTTDGTDPAVSTTARLVRNRVITIYAPNTNGNKLRVAIAGSSASEKDNNKTHASCSYDITYSTSEGGYQNYLSGDQKVKTLGGDGHVVVYVKPFSSDDNIKVADGTNTDGRIPFIYAYERVKDGASYATKSLTSPHHLLRYNDTHVTIGNETGWRYVDLVPVEGYKDVNVILGYTADGGQTYNTTEATVANACKDMFLTFDVATGQVTDVTRQYTGDHFYTTGEGGTKIENANPAATEAFCYVQVPLAWTTNGNSVKVFNGEAEYTEAKVNVQPGAQTSEFSSVCKINIPTSLEEKTELTIRPYKGDVASKLGFDITYQNGGYYFYESDKHKSSTAPLVFAQDKSGDKDQRSYGRHDFNHLQEVGNGDETHYLNKEWQSTSTEASTKTVKDNWTGSEATVYVIPAGTTISQTVTGLVPGTPYTVQMIVRGESGATGKMELDGGTYTGTAASTSASTTAAYSKSFSGYDAQGTVTTDGRVEHLLNTTAKNGWQKLETTAKVGDNGTLTISLQAANKELQFSDVTLIANANTDGHVWTKAPTSNEVTECDLSSRSAANSFSFFDRGDNKNAIIYVDANTVLGMSSNTYDVAVANGSTNAKGSLFSKESSSVSSGDEPGYTMNKLVLTDQAQDGTTDTEGKGTAAFYADAWKYHVTKSFTTKAFGLERHYNQGQRSTICLPIALTSDEIATLFGQGTKVYDLQSVNTANYTIKATEVTAIEANHPYIIEVPQTYNFGTVDVTYNVAATPDADPSKELKGGYTFYSNYEQKTIYYNDKEKCYNFGAAEGGRFYRVKVAGVAAKPFRGYIKADSSSSKATMFTLNIVDDTTTGITDMQMSSMEADAPVYTLSGVKVADKSSSSLAPGIYIQNGKKIIVK